MKLPLDYPSDFLDESPPTRGAWIETVAGSTAELCTAVAPHAGGVD